MRCCGQTIDDDSDARSTMPKEGDLLKCKFCRDEHDVPNMVFHDDAWEWRGPEAYNTDLQLQPAVRT